MVKRVWLFWLLLLTPFLSVANEQVLPLMPYPQTINVTQGKQVLTKQISLSVSGMSEQRAKVLKNSLSAAFERYHHSLISALPQETNTALSRINIQVNQGHALAFTAPKLHDDESYQLTINHNEIKLSAANDFGALRGLSTLLQLLWQAKELANETNELMLPLVNIADQPRFPWRGLMIDSARHFISVAAIKRQLDGMALAKLNVFHWHLSDDQGWRIESKRYPQLQQLASDGLYYSQQEIAEVVAYASQLGIRVVPEIDVPGHASAIAVAYPELLTEKKNYYMEDKWGVFAPVLDPSNEKVYQFIDALVAEFAPLFPDAYFHIGGDEVLPQQWQESEAVQHYMQANNLADEHALQAHFNSKVQQILAKHQRKMMGWDEIYHPQLPKDIMVQSWRGMDSLNLIANHDYQGLLSTGFYIDQSQPTSFHYRNDPLKQAPAKVVMPQAGDDVQAWQFTMPRIKGSAVTGRLVLISRNDYPIHGYLKLNDTRYQKVAIDQLLTLKRSQINVSIDSWMGPTRLEFDLSDKDNLAGRVLIGNTHYDVQGQRLAEFDFNEIELLVNLASEKQQNILGGEATLWSEMVTNENIDIRSWPRLFAIAERLWSPQSLTDNAFMYQRLIKVNQFADDAGIMHLRQQQTGFQSLLFPNSDITPLVILAEQLEPASYYTRHHLKFRKGLYHQQAPLTQFVDYLPVESLQLVEMYQQLQAYQRGNTQALQTIVNTMRKWHYNFSPVINLIKRQPKLSSLAQVVQEARKINTIGLTVAQSCLAGVKLTKAQVARVKNTTRELHSHVREIALASGLFVEALTQACRK